MRVTVWASITAPGWHHWPAATGRRDYLAAQHRHMFHITAEVGVRHSNREVEFHDLQDDMRNWWGPHPRQWGASSCEAIAQDLDNQLAELGYDVVRITVSEDGENGATLTRREWAPL